MSRLFIVVLVYMHDDIILAHFRAEMCLNEMWDFSGIWKQFGFVPLLTLNMGNSEN